MMLYFSGCTFEPSFSRLDCIQFFSCCRKPVAKFFKSNRVASRNRTLRNPVGTPIPASHILNLVFNDGGQIWNRIRSKGSLSNISLQLHRSAVEILHNAETVKGGSSKRIPEKSYQVWPQSVTLVKPASRMLLLLSPQSLITPGIGLHNHFFVTLKWLHENDVTYHDFLKSSRSFVW